MAAPGAVKTVYQTTDGRTFELEADAQAHQAGLNMKQEFGELFDAAPPISTLLKGQLINWLLANAEAIKAIYAGGDYEKPVVEEPTATA